MSDKAGLSTKRRSIREDEDVAEAIVRLTRSLGRRLSAGDPDGLQLLVFIEQALGQAWAEAVAGIRSTGASDSAIGRELHVTKQAVQQRWPRPSTERNHQA